MSPLVTLSTFRSRANGAQTRQPSGNALGLRATHTPRALQGQNSDGSRAFQGLGQWWVIGLPRALPLG